MMLFFMWLPLNGAFCVNPADTSKIVTFKTGVLFGNLAIIPFSYSLGTVPDCPKISIREEVALRKLLKQRRSGEAVNPSGFTQFECINSAWFFFLVEQSISTCYFVKGKSYCQPVANRRQLACYSWISNPLTVTQNSTVTCKLVTVGYRSEIQMMLDLMLI